MGKASNGEERTAQGAQIGKSIQDGLTNALAAPQKLFEANLATGVELMAFVSRRMQAQAELFGTITQCHGVEEVTAAQRAFLQKATEHYGAELNHLADIARKNIALMTDTMIEAPRAAN